MILSRQIEDALREEIKSGKFRPHEKFFSEKRLSSKFLCNDQTARKAVNRLVKEGLLYKKPYSGTYVAPLVKTKSILLVMPGEASLVRYCSTDELLELPYRFLEITEKEYLKAVADISIIFPDVVGVMFYLDPTYVRASFPILRERNIAFCFLGSSIHETLFKDVPAVFYSEKEIVNLAMNRLWSAGCRRIGCAGSRGWPATDERWNQYEIWLKEREQPVRKACQLEWPEGENGEVDFALICRNLAEMRSQVDGFFCITDKAAAYVVQAAAANGIRVPGELKIIGVDNASYCQLFQPELSSVDLKIKEGCRMAVQLLISQIENRKSTVHQFSPLELKERKSH